MRLLRSLWVYVRDTHYPSGGVPVRDPAFEAWWKENEAHLAAGHYHGMSWVGVHGMLRKAFEAGRRA